MAIDYDEQAGKGAGKYLMEMSKRLAKIPEDWKDAAKMRMAGHPDDEIKKQYGFTDKAYEDMLLSPEFAVLCNGQLMAQAWGGAGHALKQLISDSKKPGATRSQENVLKIVGVLKEKRDIRLAQKSEQLILHGNLSDLSKMHPHEACKAMLMNIRDELRIGKDVLLEYVDEVYLESSEE